MSKIVTLLAGNVIGLTDNPELTVEELKLVKQVAGALSYAVTDQQFIEIKQKWDVTIVDDAVVTTEGAAATLQAKLAVSIYEGQKINMQTTDMVDQKIGEMYFQEGDYKMIECRAVATSPNDNTLKYYNHFVMAFARPVGSDTIKIGAYPVDSIMRFSSGVNWRVETNYYLSSILNNTVELLVRGDDYQNTVVDWKLKILKITNLNI